MNFPQTKEALLATVKSFAFGSKVVVESYTLNNGSSFISDNEFRVVIDDDATIRYSKRDSFRRPLKVTSGWRGETKTFGSLDKLGVAVQEAVRMAKEKKEKYATERARWKREAERAKLFSKRAKNYSSLYTYERPNYRASNGDIVVLADDGREVARYRKVSL